MKGGPFQAEQQRQPNRMLASLNVRPTGAWHLQSGQSLAGSHRCSRVSARSSRLRTDAQTDSPVQQKAADAVKQEQPASQKKKTKFGYLRASGTAVYTPSRPVNNFGEFMLSKRGVNIALGLEGFSRTEVISSGVYRCYSEAKKFLSYQVAPVVDLGISLVHADPEVVSRDGVGAAAVAARGAAQAATEEGRPNNTCLIEMIQCRLEGSDAIIEQNKRFSAYCTNAVTWEGDVLRADVFLEIRLELFQGPFALLPASAVEGPGSKFLQRIVDNALPEFLQDLEAEFHRWETTEAGGGGGAAHASSDAGTMQLRV